MIALPPLRDCRCFHRAALLILAALAGPPAALAGTFGMSEFVAPGEFSLGVEPEVVLSDGAGVATNVKYTQGISDLSNLIATIGTGTGPQQFRAGAAYTFDFFPDLEGQPGIGLGTQAIYYRLNSDFGQLVLTAIPYVHKSFHVNDQRIEPFFALPFGFQFSNGQYQPTVLASFGTLFRATKHFSYVAELGVALNHAESAISGGVVYYH